MDSRCCRVYYLVGLDARIWQRDGPAGGLSEVGPGRMARWVWLVGHLGDAGAGLRYSHDSCVWDRDAALATAVQARNHNFVGKQELLLVWVLSCEA